jgi:hypothetical protein
MINRGNKYSVAQSRPPALGWKAVCLTLLLLSFPLPPAFGKDSVTPADVYAKTKELEVLVERIRFHMGAPKAVPLNLIVKNAQPHDVFYQAQTLFNKTNRLLFQIKRTKLPAPEILQNVYRPADVLELTKGTDRGLLLILKELGLPSDVEISAEKSGEILPSDVFRAIQGLNRQVNLLLETPYTPSDVYMEVTLAIGYSAKQLAKFSQVRRIPDAPKVEPGRVPSDVYLRLLQGLERLKQVYELQGLSSLEVDAERLQKEDITPSDVFDIASLMVARLDYLHKHNKIETLPRKPFYPGKVYPTDVYQQAGILLNQLSTLAEQYSRSPSR